jgi:hypothetical protein
MYLLQDQSTDARRVETVEVSVSAADPVSRAGTVAQLRAAPGIRVVDDAAGSAVALVVADEVDDDATRRIRALRRQGVERVGLLVARLDDQGLLAAVEAGVSGVLRRGDATSGNLRSMIPSPWARAPCRPICWVACSTRWGGSSARSWRRAG